jgi:hypothetical protein
MLSKMLSFPSNDPLECVRTSDGDEACLSSPVPGRFRPVAPTG